MINIDNIYVTYYKYIKYVFLFIIISKFPLSGQIIFQDANEQTDSQEMGLMFRKALLIADTLEKKYKKHYRMDIMYYGKDLIMFCDGHFDVFLWQDSIWKRLSKERKGGYNFGGKYFIWNNRIFSFGGYGYWHHHANLIEFSPRTGEWNLIELPQKLPCAPSHVTDYGLRILSDTCYQLDIQNNTIRTCPQSFSSKLIIKDLYKLSKMESAKWDFLLMKWQNLLLNKQDNTLYFSNQNTLEIFDKTLLDNYSLVQFKNDSIIKWSPEGVMISAVDVRNLITYFKPLEINCHDTLLQKTLGICGILCFAGGLFFLWHKRSKKNLLKEKPWQNHNIPLIVNSVEKTMQANQLDVLLKIDDIAPVEYRKFKRARIIAEINEEYKIKLGKELIMRYKDPDDGRKFLYKITD
jgi:hypothetical protein